MFERLIGGVVSGIGITLGRAIFNKLSSNRESSITPAIPTVVEKDYKYQKLLQQYVIQQEKREAELKQLVFDSTKMQGQQILQEEKWRELTYQQQQELIDNIAKRDDRVLQLKKQELQQLRELEELKLTLMKRWHEEKFSLQNKQILQQWDLSNWNSKLNREETEDLLKYETFQPRLLVLVSRPKVTGNKILEAEILHEQTKNTLFDLNTYISRLELEVYCDYFKNPIEDTDVPRVRKILNSIPTLIISTNIIRNRVNINCYFWNMGDDEVTKIKLESWDLNEIVDSTPENTEKIEEVEIIIGLIHKILIIYFKDLYFLNLDFFYQPILLSDSFQDIFNQNVSSLCSSIKEQMQRIYSEQKIRIMSFRNKILNTIYLFESVTINRQGQIIKRTLDQARYYREELGNGIYLDMVYISGGSFLMGSENEKNNSERPRHYVNLSNFWIGKYPVTQDQWEAIMGYNPSEFRGADRPVESVSWEECQDFCRELSELTGKRYRLPSETEWEYACRAGTTTAFSYGETITTDLANYDASYTYAEENEGKYRGETTKVGSFPANYWGLYDMHGNVWEWCNDFWNGDIEERVLRGGSWFHNPPTCRSDSRSHSNIKRKSDINGFRLVLDLDIL
ncbi:SUMF1/EgtB/PvdO family nonheme iron enzyme [Synechocystis sp. PCC 7339]|uniref:formylglycine-generating enzyme family protein n=1 Tax=Synechocystis sp. PCC 7339 TaxID=2782213 RepID=UPI001CBEF2D6|nr:formylglycine-generating enzyme family protein [Synechocystis sp. PCC 7339]UAJ73820.1 SUMF1/EgtB/PvdO family nonheme iron enzyme [Synechocystis sp. PCC 7339]